LEEKRAHLIIRNGGSAENIMYAKGIIRKKKKERGGLLEGTGGGISMKREKGEMGR